MRKRLDCYVTIVFLILSATFLLLVVHSHVANAAIYEVTIDAKDSEHGWIAVQISMDEQSPGFYTPHTFTTLSGTHTFTVPSVDSYGNPFSMWSNRWTGTALTVTSGGTYIAEYYPKVATPTFSPQAGSYSSSQNVALSCSTNGATIRYTLDDSEPSSSSTLYSSPISVGVTTTVKAKAFAGGKADSDTASATYTISIPPSIVATPTFSPPAGSYSSSQNVELSCSTAGASIRYTTDSSEPSSSSSVYSGQILVSDTITIKAEAFKNGMADSDTATATYTIDKGPSSQDPFFGNAIVYSALAIVAIVAVAGGVFFYLRKRKG